MHFITSLLSLLVVTATALPAKPAHPLQRNTPGAVYLCTGANFTGTCEELTQPINTCVDLPVNLTKQISAFGPDKGAECLLMQGHCNDDMPYIGEIVYPGIADLSTKHFDDLATSFLCLGLL